jgi:hypothetical protein
VGGGGGGGAAARPAPPAAVRVETTNNNTDWTKRKTRSHVIGSRYWLTNENPSKLHTTPTLPAHLRVGLRVAAVGLRHRNVAVQDKFESKL